MNEQVSLITAAGGNGTAIQTLNEPLTRDEYATRGKVLGEEMKRYGAEQAGFLIPNHSHFEMAGGEFCGNASRAAAMLLSETEGQPKVTFTVSGFEGTVNATVAKQSDELYNVRCEFPGEPSAYQAAHREITERFSLGEREAVGVIWFEKDQENVTIHPSSG